MDITLQLIFYFMLLILLSNLFSQVCSNLVYSYVPSLYYTVYVLTCRKSSYHVLCCVCTVDLCLELYLIDISLFFSLFLYSLRPLFEQSDKVITRHDKLIEGLIEGDSCVGSNWDKFPGYQLSFYPSRNSIYLKNVFIFHSILM